MLFLFVICPAPAFFVLFVCVVVIFFVHTTVFQALQKAKANSVVIDGYPRTRIQAECIIHMYKQLRSLWRQRLAYDFALLFLTEKKETISYTGGEVITNVVVRD